MVDITTLRATLYELKEYGINVEYALLDAGYCSENNITSLYKSGINFLIRLQNNRKIFLDSLARYKNDALSDSCQYIYNDRVVGIKTIRTKLYDNFGYVYLCVDYSSRNEQLKNFIKGAIDDKLPRVKWSSETDKMGFFALVSSVNINPEDLLPLYYQRQMVEQVFDISKNVGHIIPLAVDTEDTFRGHIMVSFMAICLYLKLNQCF
ncbi:MAG: transposase, partial [Deltaproteobacteria bacterium]|nr:transposase [Deltaproteobacteria bacterium]